MRYRDVKTMWKSGALLALLTVWGGLSFAESGAMSPEYAARTAQVRDQMSRRITDAQRAAAAATLKAERQKIYEAQQALKDAPSTEGRSSAMGTVNVDFKSIPTGPFNVDGTPAVPDYYTTPNWANSPPLAKFVDTLPGLGAGKANNLGQYLTVAVPDVTTYPGSDYYEIDLVEFTEQLHSDLPNGTKLRGYTQVNRGTALSAGTLPSQNKCGADQHPCTPADTAPGVGVTPPAVRYLGPTIISERDRPVRLKFTNRLSAGTGGDLFIPVDTSVMGAGNGPAEATGVRGQGTPCNNETEPNICAPYTQNRADIHLHGGRTPWISDGTPHQWITPADEITPFTKGVSFQNVPDMPDPGDGAMTYYYTNQQSARLMFYHDHAFGITRLNVYAGEAAGYVITDQYEQDLVARGIIPADQIPLIIQDKTFVDATMTPHPVSGVMTPKIRITDPLWNWGSAAPAANPDPAINGARPPVTGDLWLPHVYMPAQTLAANFGGVNPFGRWMYGPWFYPATDILKGPVPNPYYDADCSSPFPAVYANCKTPGQPTLIPGTPNTSMGMEAFQDSAMVNGTVFPTLTVDPRAYRFRVLNAASDRFWNLSFYEADPAQVSPDSRLLANGRSNKTEVKMLPAAVTAGWPELWPTDGRDGGVPDPAMQGPSFLQIGTEGGFLPQPVEIVPQPVTYVTDPTAFWVGVVDKVGLALGPAERADVIVDFSAYAGKTLILYNDAPAAWPARVAGYDYYTGAPDLRESGGYGTGGTFNQALGVWENGTGPLVGYAPNTRTVMQVIVRSNTGTDAPYTFNRVNLEKEFTSEAPVTDVNPAPVKTLFERSQEPIIVGQAAYSTTYPNSYFPANYPWEGINQINDQYLKFVTLAGQPVQITTEPKGIHDEMGASFDPVYGRMSGNLAMQLPNPTTLNALLILYGYSDLPTETVNNSTSLNVQVLEGTQASIPWQVTDGTQIWKISHNGVDTHPIHFHIFDVQLINRVGWDGQIRMPEPNELGWKDTIKISPLMDTIVAVRPRAPLLPFGIPKSLRPLNPAIPLNSGMGFNSVDWQTGAARNPLVTNILYDFGWEYVWHCHILSHEEMDMMRPIVLNVPTALPEQPSLSVVGKTINWTDATPGTPGAATNEIGFEIFRSTDNGTTFSSFAKALANATSYFDATAAVGYQYQVVAYNASGNSAPSNTATILTINSTPPAVSLTAPTAGTRYAIGAPISIAATATASGSMSITKVEFYADNNLLGTDTSAPYSYSWLTAPVGAHFLTAVAYDNAGNTATSASRSVTVSSLAITTDSAISFTVGTLVNQVLTVTGGIAPYTWSATVGGTLPPGVNFFPATGRLFGTPTTQGNYTFTLSVSDSLGTVVSKTFALVDSGIVIPATGVIVTSSLPSPHATGTAVVFTAAGQGSSNYQYRFQLHDGTAWSLVQDYGVGSTWTMPANTPPGGYTLAVQVRTNSAVDMDAQSFTAYQVTAPLPPATGVTVTPSLTSPQVAGTAVTFNAVGQGSSGYQYRFYLYNGTAWSLVQDYGIGSSWILPANTPAGAYTLAVHVRTSASVDMDTQSFTGYVITPAPLPPATGVTVTPSLTSPQVAGTAVTFNAVGQGSSGYLYRFYLYNGTAWSLVQDYGIGSSWILPANTPAGAYTLAVHVRTSASVDMDTQSFTGYVITPAPLPPATGVTVTPSLTSPQVAGTAVTFNAVGQGSSGYQYRFYLYNGTAWSLVQDYGIGSSWILPANTPAGAYTLAVHVRTSASVDMDTQSFTGYVITP